MKIQKDNRHQEYAGDSYVSSLSLSTIGSFAKDTSVKKSLAFRRALFTACSKLSKNGKDEASVHHGTTMTCVCRKVLALYSGPIYEA